MNPLDIARPGRLRSVFDPPHLARAGGKGWQGAEYDVLPKDWSASPAKGSKTHWLVFYKERPPYER